MRNNIENWLKIYTTTVETSYEGRKQVKTESWENFVTAFNNYLEIKPCRKYFEKKTALIKSRPFADKYPLLFAVLCISEVYGVV